VDVAPTATEADGGETVTVVTMGLGWVIDSVEADATFEGVPKTALPLMSPRNAAT
jgi:hypothetical protein